MIRKENTQEATALLQEILGEGYTWDALMGTDPRPDKPGSV